MAKTRDQKKKVIQDVKEKIDKQKSVVFAGIKGLKAKEIFDLREQLKKNDCLLLVLKKTLLNIALKERKIEVAKENLAGEVGLIFGFEDEIMPAKIAYRFSLKNKNLKILGGIFQNKFIDEKEAINLAKIPSKQELLTKVVGTIFAPISNFVNVLQGNIRGLVYILSAIKK